MANEVQSDVLSETAMKIPKKSYILLFLLVFLITVPVIPVLLYKYGIENTSNVANPVAYEIDEGDTVSNIAQELEKLEVINSALLFRAYVKINKLENKIQAGNYEIPTNVSIVDIVRMFQNGKSDSVLTFIEGWSLPEFALYASDKLDNVAYEEFMKQASSDNSYEGYLFPDTYFVSKDISTEDLLSKLTSTFEQKTKDLLTPTNLQKANLTKKEVLIFASIVEREVSDEEDRPIVAGILINRWKNGERLDADATTQYAVARKNFGTVGYPSERKLADAQDWWPSELTYDDLQLNSPYNTRFVAGLPPTPISSFGLSALSAVLNYVDTDYNFYLTDSDGVTHYARTLAEHEQNIANYL